ncbi:MAG: LPS-assembly protein LptD [Spirochaetaceae bacterium]|jgi:lipopolysaccharide assembly outer membrane protein LptD (OstA)|nr:LPS-assembly protein LptD [Spirochaetaceae bacterium]
MVIKRLLLVASPRKPLFLLALFLILSSFLDYRFSPYRLYAQDEAASGTEAVDIPDEAREAALADEETPFSAEEIEAQKEKADADRIIELEIKTSTLLELAEWCRDLGLSEGGTRDDMANRLRDYFTLPRPDGNAAAAQKVVTIEAAKTTEYFTLEAVNEEYARLSGGVELSLKDGEARHSIKAWEVVYNRTRNILSARGDVSYVKEEGDKLETFKGDDITINLDTWIGSFIDTISERSIAGSETAYRFAGQVISQTDRETTVLTKAHVTNAKTEEPYWSLNASKLWILPGSDWALFNGTLRVGEIPVLWVPFFFFPADEMVIHPALGTRTREGSFFQTTTYIFGRPAASAITQNSISQILGSGEGMERVREGLFLRTTGRKETKPDARRLSIFADVYTNLGFYVGTELALPKLGIINNFSLSGGLAFTRTIFQPESNVYLPYNIHANNEEHWDSSYIFGIELPFRYRFTTSPSFSGKYGSVSLNLPLYSDPFINYDVLNRSESIDWMEMLRQGAATPVSPDSGSTNLGAFEWNLTIRPQLSTTALSPYISNLSINSISSVYHFAYKNDLTIANEYPTSPQRTFYYPDKFTMYSISAAMSGTPVTWLSAITIGEKDKEIADPLKGFGTLRSPWEEENAAKTTASTQTIQKPFSLEVPELNQTFTIGRNSGLRITWDYSLTPSSAAELYHSTNDWASSKDIDLLDIKSILMSARTDGNTNINISEPNNNMFSLSNRVSGSWQWQDHVYINTESPEYDTQAEVDADKLSDYKSTVWTSSWAHTTTINPLYWSPAWKSTNMQYSLAGLLARSNFIGTDANNPEWEIIYTDWNKDKITSHHLTANFGVSILDKMQTLQLQAELPPRDSSVSMNSTINAWISATSINTSINQPFESEPQYRPVSFTETLTFKPGYNFRQYLIYDPSYSDLTNFTSTLTLNKFSASYVSSHNTGFALDYDGSGQIIGWKAGDSGAGRLRPVSLDFSFSTAFKKDNMLNKTMSFSLDPSLRLRLDLQRYTYSYLEFSLNFTFNVTKFLSLSMGTRSQNQEMYRYLSFLPFFNEYSSEIPKSTTKTDNFFEDLINSFRFDNEELRRNSGFKLKSFSFSATHHLGDWDAKLTINMQPWRPTNSLVYQFDTQVSFVLQWLPISELKTEIAYDGKNDLFLTK